MMYEYELILFPKAWIGQPRKAKLIYLTVDQEDGEWWPIQAFHTGVGPCYLPTSLPSYLCYWCDITPSPLCTHFLCNTHILYISPTLLLLFNPTRHPFLLTALRVITWWRRFILLFVYVVRWWWDRWLSSCPLCWDLVVSLERGVKVLIAWRKTSLWNFKLSHCESGEFIIEIISLRRVKVSFIAADLTYSCIGWPWSPKSPHWCQALYSSNSRVKQ